MLLRNLSKAGIQSPPLHRPGIARVSPICEGRGIGDDAGDDPLRENLSFTSGHTPSGHTAVQAGLDLQFEP